MRNKTLQVIGSLGVVGLLATACTSDAEDSPDAQGGGGSGDNCSSPGAGESEVMFQWHKDNNPNVGDEAQERMPITLVPHAEPRWMDNRPNDMWDNDREASYAKNRAILVVEDGNFESGSDLVIHLYHGADWTGAGGGSCELDDSLRAESYDPPNPLSSEETLESFFVINGFDYDRVDSEDEDLQMYVEDPETGVLVEVDLAGERDIVNGNSDLNRAIKDAAQEPHSCELREDGDPCRVSEY